MFNCSNIIDQWVWCEFASPEIKKRFAAFGGYDRYEDEIAFARMVGLDERGVWLENPDFPVGQGEEGEVLTKRVVYLVPWGCLLSMACFPDTKHPDELPAIGFRTSKQAKR